MKLLLTITFALFVFFCFGQDQKSETASYSIIVPYRPAVIKILNDTGILSSSINGGNYRRVTYIHMNPGQYKVQISGQGQSTFTRDSILVKQGQNLVLNFLFNGPCLYDHPKGYIPVCPKNHTDNIIPIVYGLIATRINKSTGKKEELDVKYGGCVITECDPQFYCKQHGIDF